MVTALQGHLRTEGTAQSFCTSFIAFRRLLEPVFRGNPNGRCHVHGDWKTEKMARYCVGSTTIKIVGGSRGASGNGSRSTPVPARPTYRCHWLSRKTSLSARGGISTSSVILGEFRSHHSRPVVRNTVGSLGETIGWRRKPHPTQCHTLSGPKQRKNTTGHLHSLTTAVRDVYLVEGS